VRAALVAAASAGARDGAAVGHGPADAVARTRELAGGVVSGRALRDVSAALRTEDGVAVIEVRVRARISPLGPWAPGLMTTVVAHAVLEGR
jgi:hypothetical protein